MRLVFSVFIAIFTFIACNTANAQGPEQDEILKHYEGDWLFKGDRKQMWSASRDKNGDLTFREMFIAVCGRVTRMWKIKGNPSDDKYTGSVKTIFKEETVCSVSGEWNASENTMTWSLDGDPDYAKIRHSFKGSKLIVTMLPHSDESSSAKWSELGTLDRL